MASRRTRGNRKKRGLGAAGFFLALFLLAVLAAGAAALDDLHAIRASRHETFVDIAPGSSTTRIAQQLESAGVIRSQFAFDLWRWVRKGKLKAGEYRFDHPAPLTDVYDRIARGDVLYGLGDGAGGSDHF